MDLFCVGFCESIRPGSCPGHAGEATGRIDRAHPRGGCVCAHDTKLKANLHNRHIRRKITCRDTVPLTKVTNIRSGLKLNCVHMKWGPVLSLEGANQYDTEFWGD